jgi:hypothetical protein
MLRFIWLFGFHKKVAVNENAYLANGSGTWASVSGARSTFIHAE